jgi:intracellular sulfur oxidation DsrE/DsrF family protein
MLVPPTDKGDDYMNDIASIMIVFGFAFASGSAMAADNFWQTPAIKSAGRIHPLPQSAYQPSREATYKAVFWLTKAADKPDKLSPALERVARTVNLYVNAGVPLNHLKFIAVASGPATAIALDNAHYHKQYGTANPNLPVIKELREAGIDITVCSQAVAEHHYQYDWIDSHIRLALSALTTIIDLQQKGYALVPL